MKKILILEVDSNQAIALSKYIKKYSNYFLSGWIQNESYFKPKHYDEIISCDFKSIKFSDYDYVLPMGAKSTWLFFNIFQSFEYENKIKFNTNNLVVFDKIKMLSFVDSLHIPIPKTYITQLDIEEYPVFFKESIENGGGICGLANSIDRLPQRTNLIYQEYINTPSTYGVGFLAKDGEILTYTMHKEVISYPINGGSSVVIEEYFDASLYKYTKEILQNLNYSGWGLTEFKYCDKRNDFVFMEVNAKFWASIEFMLTNNPKFLQNLLNISYQNDNTKKILFINRLFNYSIADIFRNTSHFTGSKVVFEGSIVYGVLIRVIPTRAKKYVKTLIQKIKSMKNKIHD